MDSTTLPLIFGLWVFLALSAFVIGWLAWKFSRLHHCDTDTPENGKPAVAAKR